MEDIATTICCQNRSPCGTRTQSLCNAWWLSIPACDASRLSTIHPVLSPIGEIADVQSLYKNVLPGRCLQSKCGQSSVRHRQRYRFRKRAAQSEGAYAPRWMKLHKKLTAFLFTTTISSYFPSLQLDRWSASVTARSAGRDGKGYVQLGALSIPATIAQQGERAARTASSTLQ